MRAYGKILRALELVALVRVPWILVGFPQGIIFFTKSAQLVIPMMIGRILLANLSLYLLQSWYSWHLLGRLQVPYPCMVE